MNGRGFYDWYLGELRKDNSPAASQLPFSLLNNPGNGLGQPMQSPLNTPQNAIPVNPRTGLIQYYLNQLGHPKEQQPNFNGNVYQGMPGLVNGAY